jgi:L-lysine 6-transaminase
MSKKKQGKAFETLNNYLIGDVIPIVVDLEHSHGNTIVDSLNGKSYIDCFSYIASNPIGHNHPKLSDPDFEKKLLRSAKSKPTNSDFYTLEMAEFVDTFAELATPPNFKHLFFIEGGALAVENALKAAFDWKVKKNFAKGLKSEKGSQVIHFKQAFHGRSGYTLSLTNTTDPRKINFFPKFHWPRVLNPKLSFPVTEEVLQSVKVAEKVAEAEIRKAFDNNPDDIAAIILEPIQGEGGDNHFRPEFHQKLRELADQYEAMLIYDEVQTGFGLTGKMWAFEHFGMEPDIICFGKKTQLGGIMAGPRIDDVEQNVFVESSRINSTWGGGLADMVRAQRYLEIIEEENLVKNAAQVGTYLKTKLHQLEQGYPDVISNVRGMGLMCAIDLSHPELRDKYHKQLFEDGALVLKCGLSSIRFRPSLNFSKTDVNALYDVLQKSLNKTIAD